MVTRRDVGDGGRSASICYFTPAGAEQAKTAEDLGVALGDDRIEASEAGRRAATGWFERPLLTNPDRAAGAPAVLWQTFQSGNPLPDPRCPGSSPTISSS